MNGLNFKFGKRKLSIYAGREDFRGIGENGMQKANALSRRLPNRLLRFANSAVHPGAFRVTHMVRQLLVDSESDRVDVLVEAAHETIR